MEVCRPIMHRSGRKGYGPRVDLSHILLEAVSASMAADDKEVIHISESNHVTGAKGVLSGEIITTVELITA